MVTIIHKYQEALMEHLFPKVLEVLADIKLKSKSRPRLLQYKMLSMTLRMMISTMSTWLAFTIKSNSVKWFCVLRNEKKLVFSQTTWKTMMSGCLSSGKRHFQNPLVLKKKVPTYSVAVVTGNTCSLSVVKRSSGQFGNSSTQYSAWPLPISMHIWLHLKAFSNQVAGSIASTFSSYSSSSWQSA